MSATSSVCTHTPICRCAVILSAIWTCRFRVIKLGSFGLVSKDLQGDDIFIREYTRKSREERCRCLQEGNGKFWDLQNSDISFLSLLLRFYLYLFYYRRESLPGPRAVNNSLYRHAMLTPEPEPEKALVGTAPCW
ncbi:hypothetical protein AVEN_261742-1 [Araneus ventricosus]|uniref:Uncharacterized protein n=1 Tax=Araneus ventricosus TaxID=182803 RepID=A0A4Y2K5Z8_ARAVE|nr:hypothetical protein AVEN_261742-1 [Araneus ventricosus]